MVPGPHRAGGGTGRERLAVPTAMRRDRALGVSSSRWRLTAALAGIALLAGSMGSTLVLGAVLNPVPAGATTSQTESSPSIVDATGTAQALTQSTGPTPVLTANPDYGWAYSWYPGVAGSYSFTVTGSPAPSVSISALPSHFALTNTTAAAPNLPAGTYQYTISGTGPNEEKLSTGTYLLTATDEGGTTTQPFTVNLNGGYASALGFDATLVEAPGIGQVNVTASSLPSQPFDVYLVSDGDEDGNDIAATSNTPTLIDVSGSRLGGMHLSTTKCSAGTTCQQTALSKADPDWQVAIPAESSHLVAYFSDTGATSNGTDIYINASDPTGLLQPANYEMVGDGYGPIAIRPAAASKLVYGGHPHNVPVGKTMSAIGPGDAPTVRVEDAYGNLVTTYDTESISLSSSAATLASTGKTAVTSGGVAEFPGLEFTSTAAGNTITASYGSLTPAVSAPFTVYQDPSISLGSGSLTLQGGQSADLAVTGSGFPSPQLSAKGLPPGLALVSSGGGKGSIEGVATKAGVFTATVTASNKAPGSIGSSVSGMLPVTVDGVAFASATGDVTVAPPKKHRKSSSFSIAATGYPDEPTLSVVSGHLPPGFDWVATSSVGVLRANGRLTASAAGSYPVVIRASNSLETLTKTFTITVP